jgi:hypothetical protein
VPPRREPQLPRRDLHACGRPDTPCAAAACPRTGRGSLLCRRIGAPEQKRERGGALGRKEGVRSRVCEVGGGKGVRGVKEGVRLTCGSHEQVVGIK